MKTITHFPMADKNGTIHFMDTMIIGCGNWWCGDDAVGPTLIQRLRELGLDAYVRLLDAGTTALDAAFQMRGMQRVIVVDAARTGQAPGTLSQLSGELLEQLPPPQVLHTHTLRWDHSLAFGRWLLQEEYPRELLVYLIEGACFDPGAPLSNSVAMRVETLAQQLVAELLPDRSPPTHGAAPGRSPTADQA